ncbi:succinate semialdehyde dehydrogenase NADP+ linked [Purpureocillium lilacinum]|uniref:succinate semialdehyde dehydrogenase NADP+ linked n=1 Tax=Purpureocillium lilacinum TaxID=33203 RepID=UPI002080CA4E|nr:succinate semialdehyde dehydrogenase NADP+ linked [Purpureocillium lilacinum]GJN79500.1 succinate semialdehyde dehydrogenase NADP+ linked [Purpureocillium lilacinum]
MARILTAPSGRSTTSLLRPATRQPISPKLVAPCSCSARPFSSSPALQKKRKIAPAANSPSRADKTPSQPATSHPLSAGGADAAEDPLDFSSLIAAYGPIDAHFKAQLQSVLHGGRFNPSTLGALPVTVKSTESASASASGQHHETFPLRELAQVVPRSGRTISLLVNDRAYIKPIMSAVQASREFNQQPQRAEDNDLELLLRVELERRDELVRRVREATQGWRERVRQARTRHDKALKEGKRTGAVLPDVMKRAEKELQKVQDKKMKEIDAEEAQTIKQLERH